MGNARGQGSLTRSPKSGSGQPEPPFALDSAYNGLSVDAAGKIVLGQDVGAAGNPAILLNDREIPMAGFYLDFKGSNIDVFIDDRAGTQKFEVKTPVGNRFLLVDIFNSQYGLGNVDATGTQGLLLVDGTNSRIDMKGGAGFSDRFRLDYANHVASVTSTRFETTKGSNVVAANDLTLPANGNGFLVTGNTQINAITTANWQAGSFAWLEFTGTPTIKNNTAGGAGTAPLQLSGDADFTADNGTVLWLEFDGANWQEVARKQKTKGGNNNFRNALTETGVNVEWGGILIHDTEVEQDDNTIAFLNQGDKYFLSDPALRIFEFGDVDATLNGMELNIDDGAAAVFIGNNTTQFLIDQGNQFARLNILGHIVFATDIPTETYQFGDVSNTNGGLNLKITNSTTSIQDVQPSLHRYFFLDRANGLYEIGDIDEVGNSNWFYIDDANNTILMQLGDRNYVGAETEIGSYEPGAAAMYGQLDEDTFGGVFVQSGQDVKLQSFHNDGGTSRNLALFLINHLTGRQFRVEASNPNGDFLLIDIENKAYKIGDIDTTNNGNYFSIDDANNKFFSSLSGVPVFANNAAAITGGLASGNWYRTGGDPDYIAIVH